MESKYVFQVQVLSQWYVAQAIAHEAICYGPWWQRCGGMRWKPSMLRLVFLELTHAMT
jgi:hypothetical protein